MIDPHRLAELNTPVPRYTSYPTAPEWKPLDEPTYCQHLGQLGGRPLSLYFHIPFCRTMCLYCACSVVLNRKPEREATYVNYLMREIDLVADQIGQSSPIAQLHFGGGTPTQLSADQLETILTKVGERFDLNAGGEISIEIDPRTVAEDNGEKLRALRAMGFNRVSFGVQDTNAVVQEAVRRRQSLAVTTQTFELARSLGFDEINIDLIYGLPFQTPETFAQTVREILQLRPNRIAMYSYAKVPWLKPHQKAIKDQTLPSTENKFLIYAQAREAFIEGGYVAIGMDHFALPEDPMAKAFFAKKLQRNFQGYSLHLAKDLVGMGLTATGFVRDAYFQNLKELDTYYDALDRGLLPVLRGKVLTAEDRLRKWVIHRLMCDFELDKEAFEARFEIPFDHHFREEAPALEQLVQDGLLEIDPSRLRPTFYGSLFIRNIAATFDHYLQVKGRAKRFSRAV